MKLSIILILLSLFLYSCNIKKPNEDIDETERIKNDSLNAKLMANTEELMRGSLSDSTGHINIGNDTQFSFKFNVDTARDLLKSIAVYKENKKYQTIIVNKLPQMQLYYLIDWNFDGYKDLTIYQMGGSGGRSYWIWNYSEKTKKYYYNSELSEKTGLEIDSLNKSIIIHYRGGWSTEVWDTLKYINNKLTLINGLTLERGVADSGYIWVTKTHRSLVNNNIVTEVDSPILVKEY
jgi:hypothetical protein